MRKQLLICALIAAGCTMGCSKTDEKTTSLPEAVVSVSTAIVDANGNPKTTATDTTAAPSTPEITTTVAETSVAEDTTAALSDLGKLKGIVDGYSYTNEFFGVGVNVDENWKISQDEELYQMWVDQNYYGKYTDFWASNKAMGLNLVFYIGNDPTASDIFSYAPKFCEQYKITLENSGYTVKNYKDSEVTIGDETYPYSYMTAEKDGKDPLSWGIVLMYNNEYVYDIEIVGKTEEDVINGIKMLYIK